MNLPSTETKPAQILDEWKPKPFAERKSQHITFRDYFNRFLFRTLVGSASGTAIGWGIDILRASKISSVNHGFTSFKWLGGLVGGMVGGYFNWRRNEAPLIQLDQVYRQYRDLPGLSLSNAELSDDNAVLKRILEHQYKSANNTPRSLINANPLVHEGFVHPLHSLQNSK